MKVKPLSNHTMIRLINVALMLHILALITCTTYQLSNKIKPASQTTEIRYSESPLPNLSLSTKVPSGTH